MTMNLNKIVLTKILDIMPENLKPVTLLMEVLDIGKESAYRRLRGEKPFSMEEIYKLSLVLNFSLDEIEKLAARLGIDFYDKELINLASEESGLCKEFFEKADEKASQGIIGGLFGMRFPFISEGAMPCNNCLSNDALFKVQSDVIRRLARSEERRVGKECRSRWSP